MVTLVAAPPAPPPPQHSTWIEVTPDGQTHSKVPGVLNVAVAPKAEGAARESMKPAKVEAAARSGLRALSFTVLGICWI